MKRIFLSITFCLLVSCHSLFSQLPIKVERTVSFITDEGSNMSVDISPDGKTVVFDLLGDLYTVPSKGGIATQITRGIALNKYPVWSPKGDRIAFLSDASGDNKLTIFNFLTKATYAFDQRAMGFPLWFGSTDLITISNVFFTDFPLYHLSGTKTKLPRDIYNIVGFSTDSNKVYYRQEKESGWRICQYEISTRIKKQFVECGKKEAENIKISKNVRWLSYLFKEGTSCSLVVVDLLNKKERILARWKQNVPSRKLENYNFSTDSKKILIGYGGKIHMIDTETARDEIIPFRAEVKVDMGKLSQATFNVSHDPLQVKYIRSVHTSPDGKHLVFSALNRIYILDLPDGKPRVLINQPFNQFHPSWSPEGKQIAFVSWSDKDFGQVWKVNINGKQLKQITKEAAAYHYPSFSPDGKSIAVTKASLLWEGKPLLVGRVPGLGKLLLINVDNAEVKKIADSVQLGCAAAFTKEADRIIYKPQLTTGIGNYWPCLIAKNQGGKEELLALTTPEPTIKSNLFLQQIVLSPNGKYFVYLNEGNLHLVPVIKTSVPTLLYDHVQKDDAFAIRFVRGGFDPHWEQGGKILSWSYVNQYFQIDPDKIVAEAINAAEKRAKEGGPQPEILDVDIVPDKTITIDLKAPKKIGLGLLALTNVRIITMENNKVIENGTALIKDGRFISIGKVDDIDIPLKAKVLNMAGKTIIPGLIDLHNHVRAPGGIFPQQKWDFLAGLAYGTTTSREPGGNHEGFGYEELVETGQMSGPRFFNVGNAISEEKYPNINSLEEARVIVRNHAEMGCKVIKQYALTTRLKRQLLQLACAEAGVNITNEVEQDQPGFIGHLKDGASGIEHNPLWGEAYNDVIQLIAKSGTYLTATLQVAFGTQSARENFLERFSKLDAKLTRFYTNKEIVRRNLIKIARNLDEPSFLNQSQVDAAIRHAGGRVTMGSHGEDPGLGAHFETWALQMGGLTNLEALQAATIMAAGALGMQKDLGSIEPGKIADLIVLNKNPLDNIRNTIEIQSVMKDGVLYDGDTLDEIWPVKKKFKLNKSY